MAVDQMTVEDSRQTENKNNCCCECWRDCSCAMKIIIVMLGLLIVGGISVGVTQWVTPLFKGYANNPDLEKLAVYYGNNLDGAVQPCENFYAFVCTNLRNEYKKENKTSFDTLAMLEKNLRLTLDDLLKKPLNTSDSPLLNQMKTFHQACINTTKVEAEGFEPVLGLLKEIGGWPLLSNDWNSTESWMDIVGSVNRAGFVTQFPYNLAMYFDPNNSSNMDMGLSPLLYDEHIRVLPDEKRTMEYVKRVASSLNATNDRIHDDILDCIDFESELYEITKYVLENEEIHTLESLITDYPEIPWKSFFRNVFVSTSMEVLSNETVLLSHPEYNLKISELLDRTSVKIIRNYIVWLLMEHAIPMMPEKFREAKNAFDQRPVGPSRNRDCVDTLIDQAKVAVGYLYIKNFFDGLVQNKAQDIIQSIESQANLFLNNLTWMDNDTHSRIIETLKNLKMTVPHPNDTLDAMEQLEFQSNDTTFANYRRLLSSHRNFKYSRLRISSKDDLQIFPFDHAINATALYFSSINETYVLAAMFQRPFFSTHQPMYLNYGGIGFVIAHEFTHGLRILSDCENEKCQNKKDCMVELYDKYVLEQIKETVDGKRTAAENVGDLIGLKLAYRAYDEFAKDSEEQLLPGPNYTRRQWFWINAATSFCTYQDDEDYRLNNAMNAHSPPEARVNVAFANTVEFARDFACSNTSRMNPARRCEF